MNRALGRPFLQPGPQGGILRVPRQLQELGRVQGLMEPPQRLWRRCPCETKALGLDPVSGRVGPAVAYRI